jgi:hemerythrin-like metal-binding protein
MTGRLMPTCGNVVIDDGHRTLCQHIDDIVRHWKLGSADEEMEACVRAFHQAALSHFKDEIKILEESGAATDQHRRAHRDLADEIEAVLSEALTHKDRNRWFALVDSLERMLYEHEIVEDCRYYRLLTESPG